MENVSTSREKTTSNVDHVSIDMESCLLTSMRGKLHKLDPQSPNCCIYKAPKRLRRINEAAYSPLIVSIGPLYHGEEGLKPAEKHKWTYLQDFLQRSYKNTILEDFVNFIKVEEERIRECYAEPILLSSNEFVEMILVDAAFVIEILLRYEFPNLITKNDRLFGRPRMISDARGDLLLLANQLTFFVLKEIFEMSNIKLVSNQDVPTLDKLVFSFLKIFTRVNPITNADHIDTSKVEHLIDFLRSCYLPRERKRSQPHTTPQFPKSAVQLHEAGVKFKPNSTKDLFDINFRSDGVLELPYMNIDDDTEFWLRNLLAFEQCHYKEKDIANYVIFMDSLINTSKDVELLVRSGVIESWLGDYEDLCNLFNKLNIEIVIGNDFYFTQVLN